MENSKRNIEKSNSKNAMVEETKKKTINVNPDYEDQSTNIDTDSLDKVAGGAASDLYKKWQV